jgi:TolB-like protein
MLCLRTARSLLLVALALGASASGCSSPTYVRGGEVEGFDDQAMGTTLDKRDLDQLAHENLKALLSSGIARQWNEDRSKPTLAIYPLANETTEHVGSQLDALLSDIETFMVNSNLVTVVSVERQRQMIAELEKQRGGGFDPANVAEYNKQLGAKYYITGKVYASDQRAEDERRVQYFMFLQVLDAETSDILFQNKTQVTKALVN